jgi:hypothetical protein
LQRGDVGGHGVPGGEERLGAALGPGQQEAALNRGQHRLHRGPGITAAR